MADSGPFPSVSGGFGDAPALTFDRATKPSPVLQRKVLRQGSGPVIKTGDLVVADYLGQVWSGAVFDSSYKRQQAAAVQLGIGSVMAGWDKGLVGLKTGSRVLLSVPPASGYGVEGNTSAGIKPTDTIVFVVDLGRAFDTHSTADPSAVVQRLPRGTATVTGALTAGPTIAIRPGAVIPTTKQTFLVARGHGASLRNGTAVVQYQGVNWVGQVQGSTWTNGTPTSVPIGDAATATGGLFDSIAGLPIGSRVLIEAPGTPGPDRLTTSVAVVVDIIAQVTTAKAMAV